MDKTRLQDMAMQLLFFSLIALAFLVYSPTSDASPTVSWSPSSLNVDIGAGQSTTTVASFTATKDTDGVTVRVVPEIAPYVTVSPSTFDSLTKGSTYTIDVTFTAPVDSPIGMFDGTIQLWLERSNLAKPLPVNVNVEVVDTTPEYQPGIVHQISSQTVGVLGETIIFEGTGSPLDGIQVIFPAGALPSDVQVTLGYDDGNLSPRSGTFPGVVLSLELDPIVKFDQPVQIVVPFVGDESVVPIPYYITHSGQLRPAQLVTIDRTTNTFVFQTFHASFFTWILGINVAYAPDLDDIVDTGFIPAEDGFQIVNLGSTYNREGECFGMTSFPLWFYMEKKSSRGNFYPKYYDVVGTDSDGQSLRGQDIIATRAFISIAQQWNVYFKNIVSGEQGLTDADKYSSIRNVLLNTGNPVLIYLYHTDSSPGAHSVLAYGFNDLAGDIDIYDPNHPGDVKTIHYDSDNNSFSDYGRYDGIVYNGDGSLNLTEPYQNILDDADANFQGSGNATIDITSHISGQVVTTRHVTISGIIQSGEVLINKLEVLVGPTPFSVDVGNDGAFSIPIEVDAGINHLIFNTIGSALVGDPPTVQEISVSNNTTITDFTLTANIPLSTVLMTLTWDTNDTDLDTYVIDPTGDYSSYYHEITADGGELDRDVTSGYGPEHWTLDTTDTIRYDQPYRFRVHYYSDHGNGPTNYTVTIKLYEGTEREVMSSYRGNLAVSNPSNTAPDGQGSDWADIATITLTEGVAPQTLGVLQVASQVESNDQEGIMLTVPVPPLQDRMK